MTEVKLRIKIRRDTKENWAKENTTLLEGEQGYESDTNRMKIGDGTSNWNDLRYLFTDSDMDYVDSELEMESQRSNQYTVEVVNELSDKILKALELSDDYPTFKETLTELLSVTKY